METSGTNRSGTPEGNMRGPTLPTEFRNGQISLNFRYSRWRWLV